jgi:hypothetical protein
LFSILIDDGIHKIDEAMMVFFPWWWFAGVRVEPAQKDDAPLLSSDLNTINHSRARHGPMILSKEQGTQMAPNSTK